MAMENLTRVREVDTRLSFRLHIIIVIIFIIIILP